MVSFVGNAMSGYALICYGTAHKNDVFSFMMKPEADWMIGDSKLPSRDENSIKSQCNLSIIKLG